MHGGKGHLADPTYDHLLLPLVHCEYHPDRIDDVSRIYYRLIRVPNCHTAVNKAQFIHRGSASQLLGNPIASVFGL